MNRPDYSYERLIWSDGCIPIGIDEVGRGAVAGPVAVGVMIFPYIWDGIFIENHLPKLKDSKKLTSHKRSYYHDFLKRFSYAVSFIDNQIIDKVGINAAIQKASEIAIPLVIKRYLEKYADASAEFKVIADHGLAAIEIPEVFNWQEIVKGDEKSLTIAAASIMAKHIRDKKMIDISSDYPVYDFHNNKGYLTSKHKQSIRDHGMSNLHRQSYNIKDI